VNYGILSAIDALSWCALVDGAKKAPQAGSKKKQ
jgi:hypothetical protein